MAEGPAVVGTAKCAADVALAVFNQLGALVAAAVVQDVHSTAFVSHHYHRYLVVDIGGEVVTGFGHLGLVADENPGLPPDTLHFQFKNVGVDIGPFMDAGRFHQGGDLFFADSLVHDVIPP